MMPTFFRHTNSRSKSLAFRKACRIALYFTLVVLLVAGAEISAQDSGQESYPTADDASQALFAAAQSGDKQALLQVLGPASNEIITSGDAVQDQKTREDFLSRYQEMHRVVTEPDGTATLYVGAENWPVPIPLVKKSSGWYFDTQAGKQAILFRRIGKNEFAAMDVCQALVDAEFDYYSQPRDGTPQQYAQQFGSDEGKHNGLYWKTVSGKSESPIGPLVAYAASEGYKKKQGEATPFHGYFYRILTSQGASARGGAKDYIVNGHMTGGFAIVAYPAAYRSSGVMTFIVNQDGVIYEKDLGPETIATAGEMKQYDPDKTWKKAE